MKRSSLARNRRHHRLQRAEPGQQDHRKRYPAGQWNLYVAQASDGDNWDDDSNIVVICW